MDQLDLAVGTIAEMDDIAPEGETITQAHVDQYRQDCIRAARAVGMEDPTWPVIQG
jgi:hypothetical protein